MYNTLSKIVSIISSDNLISDSLQEWGGRPTAGGYADGNLSGPSAYLLNSIRRDVSRRPTFAVGVNKSTPRVTLGLDMAVDVDRA